MERAKETGFETLGTTQWGLPLTWDRAESGSGGLNFIHLVEVDSGPDVIPLWNVNAIKQQRSPRTSSHERILLKRRNIESN